jgi:hypothetical protein
MVCDPVVTWNQLGEIEARWRDWIFSQIDASNVSVSAATSSQTQIGVIESVPLTINPNLTDMGWFFASTPLRTRV